jgi:hypothetical protein
MDTIVAHGRILWNSIYEPYEDKLHDKLSSYHPDFMGESIAAFFPFRFIRFPFFFVILLASFHFPCFSPTLAPRFPLVFPGRTRRNG